VEFKDVDVYSHDDFNYLITYYNQKKYDISFFNDDEVLVEKKSFGKYTTHLLILLVSGWFSFGLINVIYLFYCYLYKSHSLKIIYHHDDKKIDSKNKHSIKETKNIEIFLNSSKSVNHSKKVKSSGKYPTVIIDFLENEE